MKPGDAAHLGAARGTGGNRGQADQELEEPIRPLPLVNADSRRRFGAVRAYDRG